MSVAAFFQAVVGPGTEVLQPLPASASAWSSDHLRGMAVSGALARATEQVADRVVPEMRPVRWNVDLFRPAQCRPAAVSTSVIRHGRRIGVIDAELRQEGRTVARSRALFALATETPAGEVWHSDHAVLPPPADLPPRDGEARLYYSQQRGWSADAGPHHNGSRKRIWCFPVAVVEGERPTPFQLTAAVADLASLTVNWGSAGLRFINTDIDLLLTRLPARMELGLTAIDRMESGGISAGTVVVFDRDGPFGSVSVIALANCGRRADPGNGVRPEGSRQ